MNGYYLPKTKQKKSFKKHQLTNAQLISNNQQVVTNNLCNTDTSDQRRVHESEKCNYIQIIHFVKLLSVLYPVSVSVLRSSITKMNSENGERESTEIGKASGGGEVKAGGDGRINNHHSLLGK